MPKSTRLYVSVDRIEGDIAVLLSREADRWLLPADLLPEGAEEGDVLAVVLQPAPEETESRRRRIRELQSKLRERTDESRNDSR